MTATVRLHLVEGQDGRRWLALPSDYVAVSAQGAHLTLLQETMTCFRVKPEMVIRVRMWGGGEAWIVRRRPGARCVRAPMRQLRVPYHAGWLTWHRDEVRLGTVGWLSSQAKSELTIGVGDIIGHVPEKIARCPWEVWQAARIDGVCWSLRQRAGCGPDWGDEMPWLDGTGAVR